MDMRQKSKNISDGSKKNSHGFYLRRKSPDSRKISCLFGKTLIRCSHQEGSDEMTLKDSCITIAWLVLLIILLIVEIITVGLTSIWAAGGALAALILNILEFPIVVQVIVFFVVTFLLLFFTRPFAVKCINSRREKTNCEGIIGKTIRIAETVDNMSQTGMAVVNGQEWTVRAQEDEEILEAGTIAKVVNISGVKLIVRRYEEG